MKNIAKIIVLFLCCTTMYSPLFAQEEIPEMTAEQKAWMDYMTPGWAHEMLASSIGEWKTETTFWQYPGSEPMTSEGTVLNEMILGGRYLQSTHKGLAWGMEMVGISITAYDNATKEFINTWIDNLGTGIAVSKGKYEKENNSIVFMGNMVDASSGKEIEFKQVLVFVDDNTQLFEMYLFDNGNEFKMMDMKSTKM